MWYVLWTIAGNEEKTREMVNTHVDHSLFTRCIIPYRRKRDIHRGISMFVTRMLFPSYVFIETDHIYDFAKRLRGYSWKNVILQTGDFFSPIYEDEEYLLTDMLNKDDTIDSSCGFMDGDRFREITGLLHGYEERGKKMILWKSLAIPEMTICDRKVEEALGLNRIANPEFENVITPVAA